MKTAVARNTLNFIIVAVMLLSGMCFEHVEADSLFVHAVNETHNQTVVLTSAKEMPASQTICTNEMLGRQHMECQCHVVQSRKTNYRSAVRTGEALSLPEFLPKVPLLSKRMMIEVEDYKPCGRKVILAYIHHQDGAKG